MKFLRPKLRKSDSNKSSSSSGRTPRFGKPYNPSERPGTSAYKQNQQSAQNRYGRTVRERKKLAAARQQAEEAGDDALAKSLEVQERMVERRLDRLNQRLDK